MDKIVFNPMKFTTNIILQGKHNKPILVDAFHKETLLPKPIVIFCHGYKGFKDWGAWNLMAKAFSEAGFLFIKFNFSHNGGTMEQPIDFPDLEAFGQNNYTKELDDLETVIDWVFKSEKFKNEADINNISLIGHSRGGGIVTIKSEEDARITKVITLAGVSDYKSRFPKKDAFKQWQESGVFHVKNGRTHQNMPHYFQFYENFHKNEKRLHIQRAISNLKIPHLIIHGNNDTSVSINEAKTQHQWNKKSQLIIIENSNHVFETSHPWNSKKLSNNLQKVIDNCIKFINK